VSFSLSCVTVRNWKDNGAKSGPRNFPCQCISTITSCFIAVRLPSISAMRPPLPRGCILSSPAFFGG
jgi:hypothetical protein